MLIDYGIYEPFGKIFLKNREYLVQKSSENASIDFSSMVFGKPDSASSIPFFYQFSSALIGHRLTDTSKAVDLEQEAYVHGTTVVWSRGGQVIKTMDYSTEPFPIQKIVFAQFTLLEFQSEKTNEEKESKEKKKEGSEGLYKALCIVFKDYIKVCREDGLNVTCYVPFGIDQVVPLDVGLIISKSYEPETSKRIRKNSFTVSSALVPPAATETFKRRTSDAFEISPSFVTIINPLEEALPVSARDVNPIGASNLPEPFIDPQSVLFATTEPSKNGRLPVIVTLNMKDNKHYIWTYDKRKNKQHVPEKRRGSSSSVSTASTRSTRSAHSLGFKRKRALDELSDCSISKKRQRDFRETKKQSHEDHDSDDATEFEDEKEKDLYYELLGSSEISIRLLWRETHGQRITGLLKDVEKVKSSAFLVHDLNGEEMICIMNHSIDSLQLINLSKSTYSMNQCVEYKAPARCAIPVYATRDRHIDLLVLDTDHNLQLFIDKSLDPIRVQLPISAVPTQLLHPVYDRFTIEYSNGQIHRYQFNLRPKSTLVRDCLIAIDCGSTYDFPRIWIKFLKLCFISKKEPSIGSEWASFVITILSFLKLKRSFKRKTINQMSWGSLESTKPFLNIPIPVQWIDRAAEKSKDETPLSLMALIEIVHSLHVIYEDYRIKKPTARHAKTLGYLLLQLSVILGSEEWICYYKNQGLSAESIHSLEFKDEEVRSIFSGPPNIQMYLREMTPNTMSKPTLLSSFGVNALEPTLYHYTNTYARTIKSLWSIFGVMNDITSNKFDVLRHIIDEGVTRYDIEMMNDTVASPILEIINGMKTNPSVKWLIKNCLLVGRNDVYKQLETKLENCDPNTDNFKLVFFEDSKRRVEMSELMEDQITINKCIYKSDLLNKETERLRFGFDGLTESVRIMLDATRVPDHHVQEWPGLSDDDLAIKHQEQVLTVVRRTLALPMGRGIYAFATHMPDMTRTLPVEDITLAAKILPLRTIVQLEEEYAPPNILLWPKFHNGVAVGLRISPSNEVDDSWINFCLPAELTVEHGGILLGMGLVGVLKKLPMVRWVRFISHSCEQVSLGFILGAAVSYRGTQHSKITKILSVHIPSLLPDGSHSFDHSNQVIATSLVSMGLVYMQSRDRLMTTVMFQELTKNAYSNPSSLKPDYEGCPLAAGFALGFITLGTGNQLGTLEDLQMRDKLYSFMSGRDISNNEEPAHREKMNLDVTSPGATIALGLMYLKTENRKVADKVDILETRRYLNYVRPDLLLIRVVARNLIMWSTIESTAEWINHQVPDFIKNPTEEMDPEASKQAMYYIIAGACLCIGLRYAGSKKEEAIEVLLSKLDMFMRLATTRDETPQQRVTKCVIKTCIDVLCTAAAMTAAGSGNQSVLQRLQQLYNTLSPTTSYGSHIAVSMSLGLLFMGLGGYTLKTTDQAVAGLLCAFYPFYPIHTDDNKYHLQAFRHLWVLAIDSRWLLPIDVDRKKPCRVPMILELYDNKTGLLERNVRKMRIEAPVVVPDYNLIKSIQIDSHRYWPLYVTDESEHYRESIIKSGTIYVKRKKDELSYEEDPHGQTGFYMERKRLEN